MKFQLTLFFFLTFLVVKLSFAQGPTLNLVGTSPSLSKGNINTEVLTQIIQKKQEEIKQHVFRNTIVKSFNRTDSKNSKLKNFATYHMVYKLMDAVTSGKNKSVITQSILKQATDFGYVYGIVLYFQYTIPPGTSIRAGNYTFTSDMTEKAKAETKVSDIIDASKILIPQRVNDVNFLMDLCYDILKESPNLRRGFNFSIDDTDNTFSTWYKNDNIYLNAFGQNVSDRPAYTIFRAHLASKMQEFAKLISDSKDAIDAVKVFANGPDLAKKQQADELLKELFDLDENDANTYGTALGLGVPQITALKNIITEKNKNLILIKALVSFYTGLEKTEFKEFTLTKDQYYALKYLTIEFMKLARNQYKNNVVSGVINFLLENTLIEYEQDSSGLVITEETADSNDKGYLFIDITAALVHVTISHGI